LAPVDEAEGQKILTTHRQRTPLYSLSSSHVGVVAMQNNFKGLCTKTAHSASHLSSLASMAASTLCAPESQQRQTLFARPESSKLQQLQTMSAHLESLKLQQPQAPIARSQGSQASPKVGPVCRCKFLSKQLQHQQKMVQLLMQQLRKEQERFHSLEDALLESRSCLCPCITTGKSQLTSDSGPGHRDFGSS